MTPEQHAKLLIGDLIFSVAQLKAENDALREQVLKLSPPPVPSATQE